MAAETLFLGVHSSAVKTRCRLQISTWKQKTKFFKKMYIEAKYKNNLVIPRDGRSALQTPGGWGGQARPATQLATGLLSGVLCPGSLAQDSGGRGHRGGGAARPLSAALAKAHVYKQQHVGPLRWGPRVLSRPGPQRQQVPRPLHKDLVRFL